MIRCECGPDAVPLKGARVAIFCNEIHRLQQAIDTLTASNQIPVDTVSTMLADHAVKTAQIRAEMAPGFSWPDPDMAQQMSFKLDVAQADSVKMAQTIAKLTRERDRAVAERDEAVAELNELRGRHANRNTAGKNSYTRRRSRVNKDLQEMEAELALEIDLDPVIAINNMLAQNDTIESNGEQAKDYAGHSHSNQPHKKVWHFKTDCPHCGATGCLRRDRAAAELCNDFDKDRMRITVVCHIGYHYTCWACGGKQSPDLPTLRGTSFGPKALGFIVQLAGKKNVDADIAEIFRDMFEFSVSETAIWNARRAAATMLEFTMKQIMAVLKKSKFLGIDETRYTINGEKGFVWVVRSNKATLVLATPTRGAIVIIDYMSELLHIPVTTDGYSPYLIYFKILQRCWAHILRRAEEAYVRLSKDDHKRLIYYELYRQLLKIFRDAKRVAARTAKDGGADSKVCLDFERRVMALVSAYGEHSFATYLSNAAPNMFTFLRYPGMPPTNNDTERDIRDSVVVQRKIRRQFVTSSGMHVFSAIQSFNSTCRKLGLVPWKCIGRISADPSFNIFQAGPEVKRTSPSKEKIPQSPTCEAYVNGIAVEMSDIEQQDEKYITQLANSLYTEPPEDAIPAQTTTAQTGTTDDAPAPMATSTHSDEDMLVSTEITDMDRHPPAQSDNAEMCKRTTVPDVSDTSPYHGKPPPTIVA